MDDRQKRLYRRRSMRVRRQTQLARIEAKLDRLLYHFRDEPGESSSLDLDGNALNLEFEELAQVLS